MWLTQSQYFVFDPKAAFFNSLSISLHQFLLQISFFISSLIFTIRFAFFY